MIDPDRHAEANANMIPSPVDPAVAAQVTLREADYLRMLAAAMPLAKPPVTLPLLDMSPLGR
jgi:hypothetical protein